MQPVQSPRSLVCAGQCEDPGPFPLPWECTWAELPGTPCPSSHPSNTAGNKLGLMWRQKSEFYVEPAQARLTQSLLSRWCWHTTLWEHAHKTRADATPEQEFLPYPFSSMCFSKVYKQFNTLHIQKKPTFFCCVTISNTLQRWDTEYFFIKGIFNILVSLIENITAFVPGVPLPWQVFPLLILAQVL